MTKREGKIEISFAHRNLTQFFDIKPLQKLNKLHHSTEILMDKLLIKIETKLIINLSISYF